MNKFLYITGLVVALMFSNLASAGDSAFGAGAAKVDSSPSIKDMLKYAIEDEYLARAEYKLIIENFPITRPFTNIIESENTHIQLLSDVYNNHGIAIPKDNAGNHVKLPDSLHDAFAVGVQAEIDNIAMYDSFLKNPLIEKPENADVKSTFIKLMKASENHLSAFKKGLSRY